MLNNTDQPPGRGNVCDDGKKSWKPQNLHMGMLIDTTEWPKVIHWVNLPSK
jgi:hypothetical protein